MSSSLPERAATAALGLGASQAEVTKWFQEQLLAALADPLFNIPKAFETWMVDRVAVAGLNVPIGQIVGYTQNAAQSSAVSTEAHTISSAYADPSVSGGAGPTLTGLPDGKYVVFFGGSGAGTFASNVSYYMGVSINGAVPADDTQACEFSQTGNVPGSRANIVTLDTGGNNTLKCVYRSSDGTDRGNVRYRWIVAFRYANA